ncbi:uncharacterized protein LOC144916492 [Branchiostoma floridae x Branchiostoma belcheri]
MSALLYTSRNEFDEETTCCFNHANSYKTAMLWKVLLVTLAVLANFHTIYAAVIGDSQKLVFPVPRSTNNYAKPLTTLSRDLTSLTLCMHMRSELNSLVMQGLFSYAAGNRDNELLLFVEKGFNLYLQQLYQLMGDPPVWDNEWHVICSTWRNTDGAWNFYVDGSLVGDGIGYNVGGRVQTGGVFILGQDQDFVGGGFADYQAFSGEMSRVNLWDYVLSPAEIGATWAEFCNHHGNVIDWNTVNIDTFGLTSTAEYLQCKPPPCPNGEELVNCFEDPCSYTRCPAGTECVSNYCGGCNAECEPIGCGDGTELVQCLIDPCVTVLCSAGYTCVSNYCGGCNPVCVLKPEKCTSWTDWFDRDNPTGTGDWETLTDLQNENPGRICDSPTGIQARVIGTGQDASTTGENFAFYDPVNGFVCRKEDQKDGVCLDYEVRFCCPDVVPDCPEGSWTGWFDRDNPSGTGDWETLTSLRRENMGQICFVPTAVHARVISTQVEASLAGEDWFAYDTTTGFVCRIEDQEDDDECLDYEVRFCCQPCMHWTAWYDRDNPSGTGDWETLTDLRKENPGEICLTPTDIQVRVISTGQDAFLTGETFAFYDVTTGFVCIKDEQDDDTCLDYEVRFCCPPCTVWTAWFDRDNPSGTGDWESLTHLLDDYPGQICPMPTDVQARVIATGQDAYLTGEPWVYYDPVNGYACRNSQQKDGRCKDYEVRFCCPDLKPCQQPKEPGPCKGSFPRWFFNILTGQCEYFIYGGCGGNGNNFETEEECERACELNEDSCQQPKKVGPCEAIIPRWFYNSLTGQCELFDWGGCDPNDNNFLTLADCERTCKIDPCLQPKKVGPCRAIIPRWFFNSQTGQCELFNWGGCYPNDNNFLTLWDCLQVCGGLYTDPYCPSGAPFLTNHYCGRGGTPCPSNYFCQIHPTDRWAVCCPTGRCPVVTEDQLGVCVEACRDDSDCDMGKLCCSNGCGHTCQDPVFDTDAGPRRTLRTPTCSIDIVFVVDLSSSVSRSAFYYIKRFIIEFIEFFIEENVDVEIGIITYDCVPTTYLPLCTHPLTDPALIESINRLAFTGGLSGISNAIRYMRTTSDFRDGVTRAAVIMSDGRSNDNYAEEAAAARNEGIELFTVGIGNPLLVNTGALEAICGTADRGPRFKAGSELSGKVNLLCP